MRDNKKIRVHKAANFRYPSLPLARVVGMLVLLLGTALAQKDDITWTEFHPPDSKEDPKMGPPFAGAPGWQAGCRPQGDGAWYRLCQCPGSAGGTVCTITYYSLAPYFCPDPQPGKTIYLVSAIGHSKKACGKKAFDHTKKVWELLGIKWEPHDFTTDPNDTEGEGGVGQLENPKEKRPDETTPLKTKEEKTGSDKKDTDKKDTDKKDSDKKDNDKKDPDKKDPNR